MVPPIVSRLRHETQNVILPGEEEDLRRYLEERRRAGMRMNLNQLGEAVLGEDEAGDRLKANLGWLAHPDVDYISVKISAIFSQILWWRGWTRRLPKSNPGYALILPRRDGTIRSPSS